MPPLLSTEAIAGCCRWQPRGRSGCGARSDGGHRSPWWFSPPAAQREAPPRCVSHVIWDAEQARLLVIRSGTQKRTSWNLSRLRRKGGRWVGRMGRHSRVPVSCPSFKASRPSELCACSRRPFLRTHERSLKGTWMAKRKSRHPLLPRLGSVHRDRKHLAVNTQSSHVVNNSGVWSHLPLPKKASRL